MVESVSASVRKTYESYDTIDKLLAILRRTATNRPYKMAVRYDVRFGYPLEADLDPYRTTADDELFFRVTAFKALPRPQAGPFGIVAMTMGRVTASNLV